MHRPVINARFYETYHFASAIKNIVDDPSEYLRSLNDFYGDESVLRFSEPFPRFSAFHAFLEFVLDELITDTTETFFLEKWKEHADRFKNIPVLMKDLATPILPIERALDHHSIEFHSFAEWLSERNICFNDADNDLVYDYLNELRLSESYEELLFQSVREAFFLLFSNRSILLMFNEMIARSMSEIPFDELPQDYAKNFEKSGVLKRVYMPDWVRRAVFFRDRGMCVSCKSDLSGLLNVWCEHHFDHIVPLASGGLNDVTNVQLLCATCNLKKGSNTAFTSISYEDWYPLQTTTSR